MKWVNNNGYGHAVVGDLADDGWPVACGRSISMAASGVETGTMHERPFGADTCTNCHGKVKGWAADPTSAPAGLSKPAEPAEPVAMNRNQREQAIRGAKKASPSPSRRSAAREAADDISWPDEGTGGLPMTGGAVIIPPGGSKRNDRAAEDVEIDSD